MLYDSIITIKDIILMIYIAIRTNYEPFKLRKQHNSIIIFIFIFNQYIKQY